MAKWEEGFYITAMAGSTSGSSLVVMSKGTPYTQQSYKVRGDSIYVRPLVTAVANCVQGIVTCQQAATLNVCAYMRSCIFMLA